MAVVQSVLIYRSETWVMNTRISRVLGRFHHSLACRLTGGQTQRGRDLVRIYPLMEDEMTEAVVQEVETYVSRLQNTVAQCITTRPIMDLCMVAERRPGPRISNQW